MRARSSQRRINSNGGALEWVAENQPDIVVVDRDLGSAVGSFGPTGGSPAFRVCNGVRELEHGGKTLVVVLSTSGTSPAAFNADAAFTPTSFGREAADKTIRLAARKSALA